MRIRLRTSEAIEVDECPVCGHELMSERCPEITCDGGRTSHETCSECNGYGQVTWCTKCGYEVK